MRRQLSPGQLHGFVSRRTMLTPRHGWLMVWRSFDRKPALGCAVIGGQLVSQHHFLLDSSFIGSAALVAIVAEPVDAPDARDRANWIGSLA